MLIIGIADGTLILCPYRQRCSSAFWLRDHCKCDKCWHPQTHQRLFETCSIDPELAIEQTSVAEKRILVRWKDGHSSSFDTEWLKRHSYDPPNLKDKKIQLIDSAKQLWKKDTVPEQPEVDYEQVMLDDANVDGLKKWLQNIDKYGYCWVYNVPVSPEATERLVRRIAFIRESHYGTFWDFTSNLEHGDTAYTTLAIGAHTDSTYFTDPVGLQLFHLLRHDGEGGNTLLVDGFHVAQQLQQEYPQHFETLVSTPISTHSAGDKSIFMQTTPASGIPMIRRDAQGHVYQIRYNNHDRSVLSGKYLNSQQIDAFYEALRVSHELLTSAENEVWVKMKPGRAIIVDNWRVLHGRSSFNGYRRLCGAYINWDDYRSRFETVVNGGKAKTIDI